MKLKEGLLVTVSAIFAIVFAMTGIFFLFDPFELNTTQYYGFGLLTILLGALACSYEYSYRWIVSFLIIGIGMYFLACASGIIDRPWLSWIIAMVFLAGSTMLCLVIGQVWLKRHQ